MQHQLLEFSWNAYSLRQLFCWSLVESCFQKQKIAAVVLIGLHIE